MTIMPHEVSIQPLRPLYDSMESADVPEHVRERRCPACSGRGVLVRRDFGGTRVPTPGTWCIRCNGTGVRS